jgi:hypothetical protein
MPDRGASGAVIRRDRLFADFFDRVSTDAIDALVWDAM